MSKEDIQSDELLRHLQEERNKKSVSLVGLVEGDRAILSPATLVTVVVALLSLVIGGTTWIINQESKINDLTRSVETLNNNYQTINGQMDTFRSTTSDSLQNNARVNSTSVSELSSRISEAITELSTNAKINQATQEQQTTQMNMRIDNLQSSINDIRDSNEKKTARLQEVETKLKILEGRYENLRNIEVNQTKGP